MIFAKLRRKIKGLLRMRIHHYDYHHRATAHKQIAPGWIAAVELYTDDRTGSVEITETEFDLETHEWDIDFDADSKGDFLAYSYISRVEQPEESEEILA